MIAAQDFTLKSVRGRYYVNPSDSVALIEKGEWITGRPKTFETGDVTTQKIEIYPSENLIEIIDSKFNSIYEQYTKSIEEGEGEAVKYELFREYEGVKSTSLKVTKDTLFYKLNTATEEIEEITFDKLPGEFKCFPIVNIPFAWKVEIKGEEKFGITLAVKELLITPTDRKAKKRSQDKGPSILTFFKKPKT